MFTDDCGGLDTAEDEDDIDDKGRCTSVSH
jgi:hypothetical protein